MFGLLRYYIIFPIVAFFFRGLVPARVFRLHTVAGFKFEGMGCSRYIFLGCSILQPFDFFESAGKHGGGTENKQNGTRSSLTCIIFYFLFLSFFFPFSWVSMAGIHIVTVCFGVGAYSMWAIVIIIPTKIVSLFVFVSYCTFS